MTIDEKDGGNNNMLQGKGSDLCLDERVEDNINAKLVNGLGQW